MKILLYLDIDTANTFLHSSRTACLKTDNEMHDPAFTERLDQQPSLAEYLSSGTQIQRLT